jgi:hypothetical protein
MTHDEFKSLSVDDRVKFITNSSGVFKFSGRVVGYTGVVIKFDDGEEISYTFKDPWIARDFEFEKPAQAS